MPLKFFLAAFNHLHVEFDCPMDLSAIDASPLQTMKGIKIFYGTVKKACSPISSSVLHRLYPNPFSLLMCALVIKKSKTDPFWETVRLTNETSTSDVCSVTALQDYMLQTATQEPGQSVLRLYCGLYLTWTLLTNHSRSLLNLSDIDSPSLSLIASGLVPPPLPELQASMTGISRSGSM